MPVESRRVEIYRAVARHLPSATALSPKALLAFVIKLYEQR
ncbi:hypothetical protein ACVDG8_006515 [Mesorhizobium sp. ORM8.1]